MMWLLLAALPLQGWAAATMLNCGPSHHRMDVVGSQAHLHGGKPYEAHAHGSPAMVVHAMAGQAMAAHDHTSHHPGTVAEVQANQPAAEPTHQPLSLGKFKCSACAACCLAMALPSPILTFDASVSSDTIGLGMPQGQVVFLTAGLERPPRTIPA